MWCPPNNYPQLGALLPMNTLPPTKGKYFVIFFLSPPAPRGGAGTSFCLPPVLLRMCFAIQVYLQSPKQIRGTHSQWYHEQRNPSQEGGCRSLTTWVVQWGMIPLTSLGSIPMPEFSTPQPSSLLICDGLIDLPPVAEPFELRIHREAPSPSSLPSSPKGRVSQVGALLQNCCLRDWKAHAWWSWFLSWPPGPSFPSLSVFKPSSLHQPVLPWYTPSPLATNSPVPATAFPHPYPNTLSFIAA